jgi:regulatory protein
MTEKEALKLAMKLCSKKEYASGDMGNKLREWELSNESTEKVLSELIREKFIDDRRYARAFVNDKLKFSRWGKIKISFMLRQKGISRDIIADALNDIEPETYENILYTELLRKAKTLKAESEYEFRGKLVQFAVGRGFEYELAQRLVEKIN